MEWRALEALSNRFAAEKIARNNGYYHIKRESATVCQLAFSRTGHCGETLYQPLIKVRREADVAIPYYLLDVNAQPIKRLQRVSPSDAAALDQALAALIEKFQQDLVYA